MPIYKYLETYKARKDKDEWRYTCQCVDEEMSIDRYTYDNVMPCAHPLRRASSSGQPA